MPPGETVPSVAVASAETEAVAALTTADASAEPGEPYSVPETLSVVEVFRPKTLFRALLGESLGIDIERAGDAIARRQRHYGRSLARQSQRKKRQGQRSQINVLRHHSRARVWLATPSVPATSPVRWRRNPPRSSCPKWTMRHHWSGRNRARRAISAMSWPVRACRSFGRRLLSWLRAVP